MNVDEWLEEVVNWLRYLMKGNSAIRASKANVSDLTWFDATFGLKDLMNVTEKLLFIDPTFRTPVEYLHQG